MNMDLEKKPEVYPLQIGRVDWELYVKICQSFLGESPTRGIDAAGIDVKAPIAFLKTLDLGNQPINAMSQEHLYNHIFFSFMIITDISTIAQISERTELNLLFVEKRSKALVVLSGTLKEWKYAIIYCCNSRAETLLRGLFNEIFIKFEAAGFKEIWERFKQVPRGDGTFALM